jgi:hypothetical protein
MAGNYGVAIISISGDDVSVEWQANGRPTASGENVPTNTDDSSGTVNFPDDKEFTFVYKADEGRIHWSGGFEPNIWTKSPFGNYGYAIVRSTGVGSDIEVEWTGPVSTRPTATGYYTAPAVTETETYGRGAVTFPDDREYQMYFNPADETIYWDSEQSTNRWIKLSPETVVVEAAAAANLGPASFVPWYPGYGVGQSEFTWVSVVAMLSLAVVAFLTIVISICTCISNNRARRRRPTGKIADYHVTATENIEEEIAVNIE